MKKEFILPQVDIEIFESEDILMISRQTDVGDWDEFIDPDFE